MATCNRCAGDPNGDPNNFDHHNIVAWEPPVIPTFLGMQLSLAQNLHKDRDYANEMRVQVQGGDTRHNAHWIQSRVVHMDECVQSDIRADPSWICYDVSTSASNNITTYYTPARPAWHRICRVCPVRRKCAVHLSGNSIAFSAFIKCALKRFKKSLCFGSDSACCTRLGRLQIVPFSKQPLACSN